MRYLTSYMLYLLLSLLLFSPADARVWKSVKGDLEIEAEAVAFNDELVVLKRPSGELVAAALSDLSAEDQEYVRSKELKDTLKKSAAEMQTWTAKDGMKVEGRVLDYGRKELVVQRKLGQVHVDGQKFSTVEPLQQRLLLKILSHLEKQQFEDQKQLETWAKSLGGSAKTYLLEGVLLELASGDEIGVPFFLFAPEELEILRPGWELWVERKESDEARERESFLVRSAALAYQQDRAQNQQIEMLKLDLLGAASGVIAIWQVGIAPAPGTYGRPTAVMVPAQNSEAAIQMALQRFPGYQLVGVRRASR